MKDLFPEHTRRKKVIAAWIREVNDIYNKLGGTDEPLTPIERNTVHIALGTYLDQYANRVRRY